MLRTLVSATALAVVAASASFAGEGDVSWSAGYTAFDVTDSGTGVSVGAVTFRGGYEFSRHFGFEGQLDIGVDSDTVVVLATPVDLELNWAASLFGVARAPVTDNVNLFGRLGYTSAEVEASVPGVSFADDASGIAYGVGAEAFFDGRNGFRAEYTRHEFDDASADAWSITYVRRFGGNR